MKEYIDFLKENDGRIMISPYDAQMLEKVKRNIERHKLANKIISYDYGSTKWEKWHEFHINWEWYGEVPVACKSLLDGLTLDFENKKAIIYDLKTTQKLWHFEDSMIQYDYCRQICYYKHAVLWYLKHELDENPEKWNFEYYIIGIDTTGSSEIRVFSIEEYMVEDREATISYALTEIGWHQATDNWEHSREYYEGDGSEKLNL